MTVKGERTSIRGLVSRAWFTRMDLLGSTAHLVPNDWSKVRHLISADSGQVKLVLTEVRSMSLRKDSAYVCMVSSGFVLYRVGYSKCDSSRSPLNDKYCRAPCTLIQDSQNFIRPGTSRTRDCVIDQICKMMIHTFIFIETSMPCSKTLTSA